MAERMMQAFAPETNMTQAAAIEPVQTHAGYSLGTMRSIAFAVKAALEEIVESEIPIGIGDWLLRHLRQIVEQFATVPLPPMWDRDTRLEWLVIALQRAEAARAGGPDVNVVEEAEDAAQCLGKFLKMTEAA